MDLLQKDAEIMRPEEVEQLSRHFRSKIAEARKEADETAKYAVLPMQSCGKFWITASGFEIPNWNARKTGEKKAGN